MSDFIAMLAESENGRSARAATDKAGMLERVYLPFLLEAQNPDGGWGYRRGGRSAVEPTAWVLLALLEIPEVERSIVEESKELTARVSTLDFRTGQDRGVEPPPSERVNNSTLGSLPLNSATPRFLDLAPAIGQAGLRWLRERQLPDGSWPSYQGLPHGCWATAPASLALCAHGDSLDQVARGLYWLTKTWPAEGGFWRQIGDWLFGSDRVVRQDRSLRGWGWTPGTASWVEPTSLALIAFRYIPGQLHPRGSGRRRRLAESMLYDRMCPGGGWNSGNRLVYGTAGVPRIGPTVWALLALQDYQDRPENRQSLDWLEQAYPQIQGPGSLALAHLCLQLHHRPMPALEPSLGVLNSHNQFFGDTLVAAWAALSLRGRPRWLAGS